MLRFTLRRLIIIPLALILINFLGFTFASIISQFQRSQTIYGSGKEQLDPVLPVYLEYARQALKLDFGKMPIGVNEPIANAVAQAAVNSLALLGIAFLLSIMFGLLLGLSAVLVDPPKTSGWLSLLSTVGLAMPGFYVGTLLVGLMILSTYGSERQPLLPVAGFGFDQHLILPVLALAIRPSVQVAQVAGNLLAGELGKRYVVAGRAFGQTWQMIRWDKALRNVLAPIFLTVASSFRLLMAELLLVEWLFNWPGLGRMLALTLVPPRISSVGGLLDTSVFFLDPPLVAALLMVFGLFFLLADSLSSGLGRLVDPRLRVAEEEQFNG